MDFKQVANEKWLQSGAESKDLRVVGYYNAHKKNHQVHAERERTSLVARELSLLI